MSSGAPLPNPEKPERAERLLAGARSAPGGQLDRAARIVHDAGDTEFAYIKARHVTAAKRNPYEILGIDPSISNDGLKSHYRKLVAEHHPDKLIARGVPSTNLSYGKLLASVDSPIANRSDNSSRNSSRSL